MVKEYDVVVIGAGQAGPGMAVRFAEEDGLKTAMIEADKLGGTCLNYGCRPTKTLRASAYAIHQAQTGAEYGFSVGDLTIDFGAIMARKNRIIGGMQDGTNAYFESIDSMDLYYAKAHFLGKEGDFFHMQAGDDVLAAKEVYINVGARARIPNIEGLDSVNYMTNKELLALEELPQHMIVLGGGYIGLEFGQMFKRFGSDITVVEFGAHVASREDDDVTEAIEAMLRAEGLNIITMHEAIKAAQAADGTIHVTLKNRETGAETVVSGSHLLLATGRVPNSDTLNLEAVGVETNKRGFITTNGKFETNVPGIYALGDVNGRGAFTHTAYQDYEIMWDIKHGGSRTVDGRIISYAMFTDPPLGRVGMSEKEARNYDGDVLISTYQMADISRAQLDSKPIGLIKVLVDANTEQFLGGLTFGFQGDDIIQIISNFMHTGASYKVMQEALPVHPTVAEFFPTILGGLQPLK